jgi:hypothetical protein
MLRSQQCHINVSRHTRLFVISINQYFLQLLQFMPFYQPIPSPNILTSGLQHIRNFNLFHCTWGSRKLRRRSLWFHHFPRPDIFRCTCQQILQRCNPPKEWNSASIQQSWWSINSCQWCSDYLELV